jgi:benzoyl-CoA reductase/2-hydroxyglutaryl-CoA dehydratase subunit BcrC/BadD/HgdB
MVTVDISQLSGECNTWRDSLRSCRDDLNQLKKQLQQTAAQNLTRDQLHDVEHYHNQFHIQLINVHDLKQSIKSHDRRVQFETSANSGQLAEDTIAEHERLFEEFQSLDSTIKNLREEFGEFIHRTS